MPAPSAPELILRLGSHAEKEYLEKTVRFLDGVLIGANLIEATPGATASLAVSFSSGGKKNGVPVIIDPMTYAFGTYVDESARARADLDWIKSDQKVKGGGRGKTERKLKRSYRALAERLGGVFERAADEEKAITPEQLSPTVCRDVARSVVEYQCERMSEEFAKDEEFGDYAKFVPKPSFALAPYFYMDPTRFGPWVDATFRLLRAAVKEAAGLPVHAVICADRGALGDAALMAKLRQELPASGAKGVWFWFSNFDERAAPSAALATYRDLVRDLSASMRVYNLHGGFFSLALAHHGLTGVSHGIGYGERKDVLPVIGQSTPTVRYYFPPLRRGAGIPNIQVALASRGITSSAKFFSEVCDCVVCKGVIGQKLGNLAQFGDQHYSTPQSKRLAQTPAAAKRCRFHFILRRVAERDWVKKASLDQIIQALETSLDEWGGIRVIRDDAAHLAQWIKVLRG